VAAGELEADAASLAAFTMSVIQGMSTLARDGATRQRLLDVAEVAMQPFSLAKKQ
jgi:hypothetical protein